MGQSPITKTARRLVAARSWFDEAHVDRIRGVNGLPEERIVERSNILASASLPVVPVECHRRSQPLGVIALFELGLEMRAARLIAVTRSLRDHASDDEHVAEVPDELRSLIRASGCVRGADVVPAIL